MAYDFRASIREFTGVEEWLGKELSGIRSGRANPAILDGILVEAYGSREPISHVASVALGDARSLTISPWDKTMLKAIETAIAAANIGVSATNDGISLRVAFPALTEETRKNLVKLAKERFEEGRVRVRKVRESAWEDIQESEKSGDISEDDKFRAKDNLQKIVDESNGKLEAIFARKEKELLE